VLEQDPAGAFGQRSHIRCRKRFMIAILSNASEVKKEGSGAAPI
jgi:hypothetical protein